MPLHSFRSSPRLSRLLWFAAAGLLLLSGLLVRAHQDERRIMLVTARRVLGGQPLTQEQIFVRVSEFAHRELANPAYADLPPLVRLYYRLNPMHPGPSDVLRWGCDYRGGCGSHTRVVVALLQAAGIASRPLFILDERGRSVHTVVQARVDGRWVVADALFGYVFRGRDGRLATAEELQADPAELRAQTADEPRYAREYSYQHFSIMSWQKVPVVLPALRQAAIALFGAARIEGFARPSIWMWPRAMMALASAVAAALCALAAAMLGPGRATNRVREAEPMPGEGSAA